jgi:hypothetical protein
VLRLARSYLSGRWRFTRLPFLTRAWLGFPGWFVPARVSLLITAVHATVSDSPARFGVYVGAFWQLIIKEGAKYFYRFCIRSLYLNYLNTKCQLGVDSIHNTL